MCPVHFIDAILVLGRVRLMAENVLSGQCIHVYEGFPWSSQYATGPATCVCAIARVRNACRICRTVLERNYGGY